MPWVDPQPVHGDEPYVGCPFCRDEFVPAARLREMLWLADDALMDARVHDDDKGHLTRSPVVWQQGYLQRTRAGHREIRQAAGPGVTCSPHQREHRGRTVPRRVGGRLRRITVAEMAPKLKRNGRRARRAR
jgi:hypothetical protein